eukprot:jgi/Galph1/5847/GphlegSOOS_G4424.1
MPANFYWVTLIFILCFTVSIFVVKVIYRNDKDQLSLAQLCVVLTACCLYLMWVTCYLQQLYPIIRPEKPPQWEPR